MTRISLSKFLKMKPSPTKYLSKEMNPNTTRFFSNPRLSVLVIFIVTLTFFPGMTHAQSAWQLIFTGKVLDDETNKPLDSAEIFIYKADVEQKKHLTSANGKFSLVFDGGAEYTVKFSKRGYTSKL